MHVGRHHMRHISLGGAKVRNERRGGFKLWSERRGESSPLPSLRLKRPFYHSKVQVVT